MLAVISTSELVIWHVFLVYSFFDLLTCPTLRHNLHFSHFELQYLLPLWLLWQWEYYIQSLLLLLLWICAANSYKKSRMPLLHLPQIISNAQQCTMGVISKYSPFTWSPKFRTNNLTFSQNIGTNDCNIFKLKVVFRILRWGFQIRTEIKGNKKKTQKKLSFLKNKKKIVLKIVERIDWTVIMNLRIIVSTLKVNMKSSVINWKIIIQWNGREFDSSFICYEILQWNFSIVAPLTKRFLANGSSELFSINSNTLFHSKRDQNIAHLIHLRTYSFMMSW